MDRDSDWEDVANEDADINEKENETENHVDFGNQDAEIGCDLAKDTSPMADDDSAI